MRSEPGRRIGGGKTVGARTIVRRLSALRQWYEFLMLEPEQTGVQSNPVPLGGTLRSAAGMVSGQQALLRSHCSANPHLG